MRIRCGAKSSAPRLPSPSPASFSPHPSCNPLQRTRDWRFDWGQPTLGGRTCLGGQLARGWSRHEAHSPAIHGDRSNTARDCHPRGALQKVWQTLMRTLAEDFGMSDLGLKKVCWCNRIPVPGCSYWAREAAGKPVGQPILPPADDLPARVMIRGRKGRVSEEVLEALAAAGRKNEAIRFVGPGEALHQSRVHMPASGLRRAVMRR